MTTNRKTPNVEITGYFATSEQCRRNKLDRKRNRCKVNGKIYYYDIWLSKLDDVKSYGFTDIQIIGYGEIV